MAPIRRLLRITGTATAAFVLSSSPGAHADDVLRVSGTGTALGAMRRLSAAFAAASPGHRLRVLASVGTSGALEAVAQGALDVGISARPLEPAERTLGLVGIPYARTPFLFAVGPRTRITNVTPGEIARIYRGEIRAWPSGERVRVVLRPKTDVDSFILRSISDEMAKALDVAHAREGMLMALTNQECDEILARTPGAIGPTSLTQVLTEKRPLTPLAWNGVAPALASLASGAYPLSKTLVAVVRAPLSPAVRRFLSFLGSPEAHKILEETGNLPLPLSIPD